MKSDFKIIENNYKAKAKYGFYYGTSFLEMTKKDIKALLER